MGKENGIFVFSANGQATEEEACELTQRLIADIIADNSTVQWSFEQNRSNLSAFVGTLNNQRFHVESKNAPNGPMVHLECHNGGNHMYTVVDLCFEPEKSEILELYVRVSKRVFAELLQKRA